MSSNTSVFNWVLSRKEVRNKKFLDPQYFTTFMKVMSKFVEKVELHFQTTIIITKSLNEIIEHQISKTFWPKKKQTFQSVSFWTLHLGLPEIFEFQIWELCWPGPWRHPVAIELSLSKPSKRRSDKTSPATLTFTKKFVQQRTFL